MNKITKSLTALWASSLLLGAIGITSIFSNNINHNEKFVMQQNTNNVLSTTKATTDVSKIQYEASTSSNTIFGVVKDANGGADRLYWWGQNKSQTGTTSTAAYAPYPTQVDLEIDGNFTIAKVVNSTTHSMLLTGDGTIWSVGVNTNGELGLGNTTPYKTFRPIDPARFGNVRVKDIAVGEGFSLAITEDNKLYGWGRSAAGQLGLGDDVFLDKLIPTQNENPIFTKTKVLSSPQAYDGTAGVLVDGELYLWGDNTLNQLGKENIAYSANPTQPFASGQKILFYALGKSVFVKTADTNKIYGWGNNNLSQTGIVGAALITTPQLVTLPVGNAWVKQIISFGDSTMMLLQDPVKKIYMCVAGDNKEGQLDRDKYDNATTGFQMSYTVSIYNTSLIGSNKAIFCKITNSFYITGDNSFRQRGQSGNNINVFTETIIFKGSPSAIVQKAGNSAILAETAFNGVWNGTTINIENLKKYVDFVNYPSAIIIKNSPSRPTYNTISGTFGDSGNLSSSIIYSGEDGHVKEGSWSVPVEINNFKNDVTTDITLRSDYKKDILAASFYSYLIVDGYSNRGRFEDFFILTDVPTAAIFKRVSDSSSTDGTVEFSFTVSKIITASGGEQNVVSKVFSFVFEVAKMITKITATTGKINSNDVDFIASLAIDDKQQITNMTAFGKYSDIINSINGAKYYLIEGSKNYNGKTGILDMTIYATNYYNTAGQLRTVGSVFEQGSHFPLKFQLKSTLVDISTVTKVTNPPVNIQVQSFSGANGFNLNQTDNGLVQNVEELKKYLDLNTFNPITKFYLRNEVFGEYNNFTRNTVSYELFSDRYYPNTNPDQEIINADKSWGIFSFVGLPQHQATSFVAKTSGYPTTFMPSTFKEKLIADGAVFNDKTATLTAVNVTFLKDFINFNSIVNDATFSLTDFTTNNITGSVSFKIQPSSFYDVNGNVLTTQGNFNISLTLNTMGASTITVRETYPTNLRPNQFVNYITGGNSGDVVDRAKIEEFYTLENIPTDSVITINSVIIGPSSIEGITNIIMFGLNFSKFNMENGQIVNFTEGGLSLSLGNQYAPTSFTAKSEGFPTNFNPITFQKQLIEDGATETENGLLMSAENITFLEQFIEFYSLVAGATYHININAVNNTGVVNLAIRPSQFYANDGSVSSDQIEFAVELNLNKSPSNVKEKENYPTTLRPNEFVNYITNSNADKIVDQTKLAEFFTLTDIPNDSVITIENITLGAANAEGIINSISFNLNFSEFADADGNISKKSFGFELFLANQYAPTNFTIDVNKIPRDIMPSIFIEELIKAGAVDGDQQDVLNLNGNSLAWLEKFGIFENKVVGSKWSLKFKTIADANGKLVFEVFTNTYYSDEGVLEGTTASGIDFNYVVATVEMNLAETSYIPDATKITTRADSPTVLDSDSFIQTIKNKDGSWNLEELAKYVDGLETIPTLATIEDITFVKNLGSKDEFKIDVSAWWNGETNELQPKTSFTFNVNVNERLTDTETSSLWWIIIVSILAAAGTGGLGLATWYFLIHKKNKTSEILEN